MIIYQFISKFLFRMSKKHKFKSQGNKKNNGDGLLKQKFKRYECIQYKQEERIKQLELKCSFLEELGRKCLLLEERVEMLEWTEKSKNEIEGETLSNVISCDIQQSNESVRKDSQNKNYVIPLSIQSGGKLKQAEVGDVVYYRAWQEKGKLYFVFVNSERTLKAINNRTTIIEPFCDNVGSMKSPDNADSIEVVKEGVLDDNFLILERVKIKYI